MKRVFLLMLSLLVLFSMAACSSSQPGNKETLSEHPEGKNAEDPQAEIPEEYCLKTNIPDDWHDPLPSSEYAGDFPLFGLGALVDGAQEGVSLPQVIDLFTIDELETYLGMIVSVDENLYSLEGDDVEQYFLRETETAIPELWDGKIKIWLKDLGNPAGVSFYLEQLYPNSREIEDLGEQAIISTSNTVIIQVKGAVIVGISAEFKRPEDRVAEPAEEKFMLDLAHFVSDRLIEKMSSPGQAGETDTETGTAQQENKSFKALGPGEFEAYIDKLDLIKKYVDEINAECSAAINLRPLRYPEFEKILTNLAQKGGPDVFITSQPSFYEEALKQDLFSEGVVVAYETPVIMVHVGNPKGITGLANLAKKDMRVAMADQDTPEGQMIRAMLAKAGITEEDFSVRSQYEVNFDAAIVYRNAVSAKEKEEYEFVEIEPDYLIENPVFLFATKSTEHPELVDQFTGFMLSERVQHSFEVFGYRPVK